MLVGIFGTGECGTGKQEYFIQVCVLNDASPSSLSTPCSYHATLQAYILLGRNQLKGFVGEKNLGYLSATLGLFSLVGKIP